jgi:hypothetical protein
MLKLKDILIFEKKLKVLILEKKKIFIQVKQVVQLLLD